jgi:hypothetical protein
MSWYGFAHPDDLFLISWAYHTDLQAAPNRTRTPAPPGGWVGWVPAWVYDLEREGEAPPPSDIREIPKHAVQSACIPATEAAPPRRAAPAAPRVPAAAPPPRRGLTPGG